jgi:hypothetical protein
MSPFDHEVRDHLQPCEHGNLGSHPTDMWIDGPNGTGHWRFCHGGKLLESRTYDQNFYIPDGTMVYFSDEL